MMGQVTSAAQAMFVSALGVFVPLVLYALLVWWFDRYEKEPLLPIGATWLAGSLTALVVAFLVRPLVLAVSTAPFAPVTGRFWGYVVWTAAAEEIVKSAFLVALFLLYAREFDSLYDGFFYGSLVGFAFAAADTVLAAPARQFGFGEAVERTFSFGLWHAFFSAWVGVGLAAARLSKVPQRWLWPVLGVGAAVGFHVVRNAVLAPTLWDSRLAWVQSAVVWAGVLFLAGVVVYGIARESTWIARYLADEVQAGTVSAALYEALRSPGNYVKYRWQPLLEGDVITWQWRGLQAQVAAELAFRKHQLQTLGESKWQTEVERLRQVLRQLA